MRIGLTGGIATGKTTVAERLRQLGASLLDADRVSRDLTVPGSPVLRQLVEAFGPGILRDDGSLDRPGLGRLAFSDPGKLELLNSITHPAIWKEIHRQLGELSSISSVVVLVAPLLLEHRGEGYVDQVWVVHVPQEVQVARLRQRDSLGEEAALERLRAQMAPEERLRQAHVVIDNSGSLDETLRQVDQAWDTMVRPALSESSARTVPQTDGTGVSSRPD